MVNNVFYELIVFGGNHPTKAATIRSLLFKVVYQQQVGNKKMLKWLMKFISKIFSKYMFETALSKE